MKKLFIRSSIILLWILLIFAALYWPKWQVFSYDSNTINIFGWGDILDPAIITQFEKETGIKVNLNYYSSNEELIVKLRATHGEGYDLIIPSDYAVNILIDEGLVQELDRKKLEFWQHINPALLGHFFDPDNRYSIPFEWEIFGLGVDKEYFQAHPTTPSWAMLFDPKIVHYKITMNNDPIEAAGIASFYLYGPRTSLTEEEIQGVRNVLVEQKKWVTAYANFRGDYFLATRNCAVVLASSSYIWRTKRLFDFVGFVVPEEGSFITIENLCLTKPTKKQELVYQFINFLYRKESVASHFHTYGFFPSTTHALDIMDMDEQAAQLLLASEEEFKKFHFVENLIPQDELRDIWVEVKTSG
jgi:spermidine/putrescine transport system substrate-binding protein